MERFPKAKAVEADGAGVGTHDLAGEGEADAGAFGAGGEEGVENVVGVLIGNGVSVVGDVDLGVVGGVDEGGDTDDRDIRSRAVLEPVAAVIRMRGTSSRGAAAGAAFSPNRSRRALSAFFRMLATTCRISCSSAKRTISSSSRAISTRPPSSSTPGSSGEST